MTEITDAMREAGRQVAREFTRDNGERFATSNGGLSTPDMDELFAQVYRAMNAASAPTKEATDG